MQAAGMNEAGSSSAGSSTTADAAAADTARTLGGGLYVIDPRRERGSAAIDGTRATDLPAETSAA